MIRLSNLVAIDILDSYSLDINPQNNSLYCYETLENNIVNKQLVFDDSFKIPYLSRKGSLSPYFNNIFLGGNEFYPEDGLNLTNYHQNSKFQNVLSENVLPNVEIKKAKLYFGQGLLSNDKIVGHYLRIYVILDDDSTVTLCSVVDFRSDTHVKATSPKYFENQIFSESLDIEFLDIDSINYSLNSDIYRDKILNGNKPQTYFIEYSSFTEEGVDNIIENRYVFTTVNFDIINEQSINNDISDEDLYCMITDYEYYLYSRLYHNKYDVEDYLNKLKENGESYEIEHIYNVYEYNINDELINTQSITLENNLNIYDGIQFRPIVNNSCDYFDLELTIVIKNLNTSLSTKRYTSYLITSNNVSNYKAKESYKLELKTENINKVVNRNVNKIVSPLDVPKVIQIEKVVHVISQPLDNIQILPSDFILKLDLQNTVNSFSKIYLRIGDYTFENIKQGEAIFEISERVYSARKEKYILLDENMKAIGIGTVSYI